MLNRTFILLLLLKKPGSARLRESDVHPISPKTPAPQYQPIDIKRRKGKKVENCSRERAAKSNKKALALLLKPACFGLSPASRETTQTNKPPKHYTKTGGHNISSSLKKKRKQTQWVSATIMVQV